jgi:S-DNA-T family DNA segregation ATPase FtsK/SpoIIIE
MPHRPGEGPISKTGPKPRLNPKKAAPVQSRKTPAVLAPRSRARARSRPVLTGLSPERKIDLVGILLALAGLLTLLSLFSPTRGSVTGWWVGILMQAVGWGVYILPLGLLLIGLWMVLRNIERLPQLSLERVVGLVLLFFNILIWMQLFFGGDLPSAQVVDGGGYAGALITPLLVDNLGQAGSIIVLVAWLLVALALSLDLSIPEIFTPIWARLRSAWASYQAQRSLLPPPSQTPGGLSLEKLQPGLIPLQRSTVTEDSTSSSTPSVGRQTGTSQSSGQPGGALPVEPSVQTGASGLTPPTPWVLPVISQILEAGIPAVANDDVDQQRARLIEETLKSFGAPARVIEIHRGPTITQYGVEPNFIENRAGRTRVRVSKIVSLADDLALALAASRIRIQAPVPGRAYVGIEVPNSEISRVTLRDVIESEGFQKINSPLRFALGKDVAGKSVSANLAAMPHLLIAGTTGAGKSVLVNAILSCFLINNTPDNLRLILVDPKRVELTGYNGVPHLLAPVVVEPERVVGALQWMMREMDNRYHKFAQIGARNIVDYNARIHEKGEKPIPYLVVVIDELADLMMMAPDETERSITRLAQLARATGLHLILATQRPSVDVLTGLIKANFPARVAFAVASGVDSRVILDQPGAERLLGRGDMLFQAPDAPAPVRLQGVYVSEIEIQRLVDYWRQASSQNTTEMPPNPVVDAVPQGVPLKQTPLWDDMAPEQEGDPLLKDAIDLVRREGRASISMLQRRMRVGYTRAARLVDTMEEKGIIGPSQSNTQVREVLDYGPAAPPIEKED